MRIFKGVDFDCWAKKEQVGDESLLKAIEEISDGLVDANLGGGLMKKRVALDGRGKRGGARTILAFRSGKRAFFIHGFAKNKKSTLTAKETKALKQLAKTYFSLSDAELDKVVKQKKLIEIMTKGDYHEKINTRSCT